MLISFAFYSSYLCIVIFKIINININKHFIYIIVYITKLPDLSSNYLFLYPARDLWVTEWTMGFLTASYSKQESLLIIIKQE